MCPVALRLQHQTSIWKELRKWPSRSGTCLYVSRLSKTLGGSPEAIAGKRDVYGHRHRRKLQQLNAHIRRDGSPVYEPASDTDQNNLEHPRKQYGRRIQHAGFRWYSIYASAGVKFLV